MADREYARGRVEALHEASNMIYSLARELINVPTMEEAIAKLLQLDDELRERAFLQEVEAGLRQA